MSAQERDECYMRKVLTLAGEALELGEFPIAAIVLLDGKVVGKATASEQRERRFLGHAELVAVGQLDRADLGTFSAARAAIDVYVARFLAQGNREITRLAFNFKDIRVGQYFDIGVLVVLDVSW